MPGTSFGLALSTDRRYLDRLPPSVLLLRGGRRAAGGVTVHSRSAVRPTAGGNRTAKLLESEPLAFDHDPPVVSRPAVLPLVRQDGARLASGGRYGMVKELQHRCQWDAFHAFRAGPSRPEYSMRWDPSDRTP